MDGELAVECVRLRLHRGRHMKLPQFGDLVAGARFPQVTGGHIDQLLNFAQHFFGGDRYVAKSFDGSGAVVDALPKRCLLFEQVLEGGHVDLYVAVPHLRLVLETGHAGAGLFTFWCVILKVDKERNAVRFECRVLYLILIQPSTPVR